MDDFKLTQLIQQLRYYGQLRFAICTLFLAVTAGLLAAFYRTDSGWSRLTLMFSGMIFSLVFSYFQLKLSAIHSLCLSELQSLAGKEKTVGKQFISQMFGETLEDKISDRLETYQRKLLPYLPIKIKQADDNYLGPVTMAVLLLHLLIAGLWLLLFVIEECQRAGCGPCP